MDICLEKQEVSDQNLCPTEVIQEEKQSKLPQKNNFYRALSRSNKLRSNLFFFSYSLKLQKKQKILLLICNHNEPETNDGTCYTQKIQVFTY